MKPPSLASQTLGATTQGPLSADPQLRALIAFAAEVPGAELIKSDLEGMYLECDLEKYPKVNNKREGTIPPISGPKLPTTALRSFIVPPRVPLREHGVLTPTNVDLGSLFVLSALLVRVVVVDGILDCVPVVVHVAVSAVRMLSCNGD